MFRPIDSILWTIEEEQPPADISMPRVFRRPAFPPLARGKAPVGGLAHRASQALKAGDGPELGKAYGELVAEFQPAIRWALSCREYLLSTQGCRFLARTPDEKRYCRGDYRIFSENDFHSLIHRCFKDTLISYLESLYPTDFREYVENHFWWMILRSYRALLQPPDPRQRRLTPYSYLRCVPYQFLNPYHHERVGRAVAELPRLQREVVDLYYLKFYKEEAVFSTARISRYAFWRRRKAALRAIAANDYLSFILLTQIERY